MTTPGTYDIIAYANVPYVQGFQIVDAADTPIDVTGYDFNMDVRQYAGAAGAQVALATVVTAIQGIRIVTAASGLIEVRIDQTTLDAIALPNPAQPAGDDAGQPGIYYHDLMVTPSGGDDQLYWVGKFTVYEGVTTP